MSRPSAEPTATVGGARSRRIREEGVYVRHCDGKAVRRASEVRHSRHDVSMLIVRRACASLVAHGGDEGVKRIARLADELTVALASHRRADVPTADQIFVGESRQVVEPCDGTAFVPDDGFDAEHLQRRAEGTGGDPN